MNDLAQFLHGRIEEDYEAARLALGVNLMADLQNGKPAPRWELQNDGTIRDSGDRATPRVKGTWLREAEHIVRHDPARVLADIEAKRRIISDYEKAALSLAAAGQSGTAYDLMTGATNALASTLRVLALPYTDHADYREEWRP